MEEYFNELNGYNFTGCKTYYKMEDATKYLSNRTSKPSILISSGSLCKLEKPKTLLDLIKETKGASNKIIDHIIYCGDQKAYMPTQ
jgi:hypothetical protein